MVDFHGGNPVAVQVAVPDGDSGPFELMVRVREMLPDTGTDPLPGDIDLTDISMELAPVGSGGRVPGTCVVDGVYDVGYNAYKRVTCSFDDVQVNTYVIEVSDSGGYYGSYGEDVLVIYDPSLGFTTGGGTFEWPETGEETSFAYTMEYNKKGKNLQGSLLLIRHLPDGSFYRVKSNALYGLALGQDPTGAEMFDWASFSGKATYKDSQWDEAQGNHEFRVYVEDWDVNGENGADPDRVWIEILDKDGVRIEILSMEEPASLNTVPISEGEIVVPWGGGRGGGPRII